MRKIFDKEFIIVGVFGFILLSIIALTAIYIDSNSKTYEIECIIIDKTIQKKITSDSEGYTSTTFKYYITTNKGTFDIRNTFMHKTYNPEEIYFTLQKDSVYTLKIAGKPKNLFLPYPNIIKIIK